MLAAAAVVACTGAAAALQQLKSCCARSAWPLQQPCGIILAPLCRPRIATRWPHMPRSSACTSLQQGEGQPGRHTRKGCDCWRQVPGAAGRFRRTYQQNRHNKITIPGKGPIRLCYSHWCNMRKSPTAAALVALGAAAWWCALPLAEGLPQTAPALAYDSTPQLFPCYCTRRHVLICRRCCPCRRCHCMAAGRVLGELGVGLQTRQVAITHCGKHWRVTVYRPPPQSTASTALQASPAQYDGNFC